MPEIGEVAGLVQKLRNHLLNQTIESATATYHSNVFVSIDAEKLEKALTGRKVTEIGSWGKYFWIGFSDGGDWLVGVRSLDLSAYDCLFSSFHLHRRFQAK